MGRRKAVRGVEVRMRDGEVLDLASLPVAASPAEGIVIGVLVAPSEGGAWAVEFPLGRGTRRSGFRTLVALGPEDGGRSVALFFEEGDATRPIVLGVVRDADERRGEAVGDCDRVVIEARREIELRCGESSIVLTREGRIRIRGRDLVSRSAGGNRIKGASVRIN